MSHSQSGLVTLTRWVTVVAFWFVAGISLVCLVAAAGSIFSWPQIAVEITTEHPGIDVASFRPLIPGLLMVASLMLGLVAWGLRKLLALVDSVRLGDPFTGANVARLRAIGWIMITVQLVGLALNMLASRIEAQGVDFKMDAGISLNGLLAILFVFVLAGVFERGVAMREDLEGTV